MHGWDRKDDMERGKETDGITLQTPQAGHKRVKRKGNANVYEKPPKTESFELRVLTYKLTLAGLTPFA